MPSPSLAFGSKGQITVILAFCSSLCNRSSAAISYLSVINDEKRLLVVIVMRGGKSEVLYYELGPEDPPYAAKFYDCCGAEDPEASGCTTSFHVSYDD
ncbi:hypothetical protein POTOM_044271 [Populus tomentosa]|uniref:Uncharacterized protein n=1 Tax=Populus tomentosa TaxID=118781 RepID=A0A8X7YLE9_POPTO|nr:hypothetical protein POTOM_044271 [Populus tomentosa]